MVFLVGKLLFFYFNFLIMPILLVAVMLIVLVANIVNLVRINKYNKKFSEKPYDAYKSEKTCSNQFENQVGQVFCSL